MEIFKTLKPGQPGTKRLSRQYGEKLLTVRYRKGSNPNKIYTTVELIVDSRPYHPALTHVPAKSAENHEKVPLQIPYEEVKVREIVKKAGGWWDNNKKLWYLNYKKVKDLGLKRWMLKI